MTDRPSQMQDDRDVELLNPMMAAFLAWLMPGLGHLYQRRTAKAILFFVCIVGTFAYGVYLGGDETHGYGRAVYAWFDKEGRRLPYLCQVWVGLPAMPALIETMRADGGRQPLFGGFMCPPKPGVAKGPPPRYSLGELKRIPGFELGTTFTMIAGLLNVLAIYDAWDGPVSYEATRKKDEEDDDDDEDEDEREDDV